MNFVTIISYDLHTQSLEVYMVFHVCDLIQLFYVASGCTFLDIHLSLICTGD
jgi:hypothetical protein